MNLKRSLALLVTLALLLALSVVPTVSAATTRAYLIGSKGPLTSAQVKALKAAGVSVSYVYRNFGGAAGTIPSTKVDTVRALKFVTSVHRDTIRQVTSLGAVTPDQHRQLRRSGGPAGHAVLARPDRRGEECDL